MLRGLSDEFQIDERIIRNMFMLAIPTSFLLWGFLILVLVLLEPITSCCTVNR